MSVFNPEGSYRAKIGLVQIGQARNEKKTPQLELHLELSAHYDQDQKDWFEHPQPRFAPIVYLSLTEATMGSPGNPGWVANLLSYLGFDGDFDKIAALEGTEVEALCQYEEPPTKPGTQRERWSIIVPRAERAPTDRTVTRDLKARFGKLFKAPRRAPASPPPPKPQPVPSGNGSPASEPDPIDGGPPVGDNIPF
jgi:hypothetical protein